MISVYTVESWQKWSEIINSFPDYDVYYLPQYTKAFALHGDGEPQLVYFEGGGLRAANVVMQRDIATDKNFAGKIVKNSYLDLTTPYGYGGWIFDGKLSNKNINILHEAYSEYCSSKGIVTEFMRFHPLLNSEIICSNIYEIVTHGPVVCMDISEPETIWKNISTLKRNRIRKATKNGVSIHHGLNGKILDQFQDLYNKTMEKNEAEQYYLFGKEFYNSILKDLNENTQVFYAMKDEIVIASMIMIMADSKISYHLGGSDMKYRDNEPNSLLFYNAALWGCEHGFKTMLLGGGLGSREDSLYQFKKGFNVKSNHVFRTGRKIFNRQKYLELCDIRNEMGNSTGDSLFFPEYRA